MNTVVSQEELELMFNETLKEVTHRIGGIRLSQSDAAVPTGEVYTVYITFERGVYARLCLSAEKSLFIRLTRYMMRREDVSEQDVEDFSKEYFNVVCGHIAAKLFRATKIASRFGAPGFCSGRYQPADYEEHLVLGYSGDQSEGAQLIHLRPLETPGGELAGLCTDAALSGKENSTNGKTNHDR